MKKMASDLNIGKKVAAEAVETLRKEILLNEVHKTAIANAVGINRNTVAKYLNDGDMKLSEFYNMAIAAGIDPLKTYEIAVHKQAEASFEDAINEEKAPAATGANDIKR